jgi:hypothetical protein
VLSRKRHFVYKYMGRKFRLFPVLKHRAVKTYEEVEIKLNAFLNSASHPIQVAQEAGWVSQWWRRQISARTWNRIPVFPSLPVSHFIHWHVFSTNLFLITYYNFMCLFKPSCEVTTCTVLLNTSWNQIRAVGVHFVLFMIYLTTPSEAQTMQRLMIGWLTNNLLESIWKEAVVA